ncbi:MAG: menaquinone biosynthesis protein [Verrucomicrobia bacterium]|nr:menaquinone biosynthesis protein [Verrucomicrobiota bacterium]
MNGFEALNGLRVGCVRYLNSRPLIDPYDGPVVLDHPAVLAAALERGELDVALVPVFEALRLPGYRTVEGVSISSLGPVWSVILAYQGALSAIRQVTLDPASRTSVHLCKLFFAEWGASVPEYLPEPPPPGAARVLIGNQAIAFRDLHGDQYEVLDLGEEWTRRTGLPFVFAVWLIRPEVPNPERVAAAFREIARQGRTQIPEIVARHREHHASFALRYLTESIRFDLGAAEKEGIKRFRTLLCKHALLPTGSMPLRFV